MPSVLSTIVFSLYRNPDASRRPKFDLLKSQISKLTDMLASDDSKAALGTGIDRDNTALYTDLQNKYRL